MRLESGGNAQLPPSHCDHAEAGTGVACSGHRSVCLLSPPSGGGGAAGRLGRRVSLQFGGCEHRPGRSGVPVTARSGRPRSRSWGGSVQKEPPATAAWESRAAEQIQSEAAERRCRSSGSWTQSRVASQPREGQRRNDGSERPPAPCAPRSGERVQGLETVRPVLSQVQLLQLVPGWETPASGSPGGSPSGARVRAACPGFPLTE